MKVLIFLLFSTCLSFGQTLPELDDFVLGAQKLGLPVMYLREAIPHVKAIRTVESVQNKKWFNEITQKVFVVPYNFYVKGERKIGKLHPQTKIFYSFDQHILYLSSEYFNEGVLKPFDQLTPSEISGMYHELWHCYFHSVLEDKISDRVLLQFLKSLRVDYGEVDLDKAREILEEGYADAIENYILLFSNALVVLNRHKEQIRTNQLEHLNTFNTSYDEQMAESNFQGYSNSQATAEMLENKYLSEDDIKVIKKYLLEGRLAPTFKELLLYWDSTQ